MDIKEFIKQYNAITAHGLCKIRTDKVKLILDKEKRNIKSRYAFTRLLQLVLDEYRLKSTDVLRLTREKTAKEVRFIYFYLMLKYQSIHRLSLMKIGATLSHEGKINGYDHATVLHARKTVQNWMDTDKEMKQLVNRIIERV